MQAIDLHKAQVSILTTLRHSKGARYTDLRVPTGLESDVFKFHLRKLTYFGLVNKNSSGEYELTAKGKEFSNNIDRVKRSTKRRPKLSMLIVAQKPDEKGIYLFQQRNRQPFFGHWGLISGPVLWGEDFEISAKREFEKQTGLIARYEVRSFFRQKDYSDSSYEILEDKLFVIIEAKDIRGKMKNKWLHGNNSWLTIEELETQEQYFSETRQQIRMIESKRFFSKKTLTHSDSNY